MFDRTDDVEIFDLPPERCYIAPGFSDRVFCPSLAPSTRGWPTLGCITIPFFFLHRDCFPSNFDPLSTLVMTLFQTFPALELPQLSPGVSSVRFGSWRLNLLRFLRGHHLPSRTFSFASC